jgi:poly-beta-1,6-N-acetyl-D-glucosamine synthase
VSPVAETEGGRLSYALITPVRDEADGLRSLGRCVEAQTLLPTAWLIVDTGSSDETPTVAAEIARMLPWVRLLFLPGNGARPARGAPVVRAFHAGLKALETSYDVVVKLDADVTMPRDHFERLAAAFALDPRLGIASGCRYERSRDRWRLVHVTGTSVDGQCRAYRAECLRDVLPLEEALGWDGIDEFKANVAGWRTGRVDLAFRHHRVEGARDGSRWKYWFGEGTAAHYMGYRPSYLVFRAVCRSIADPAAVAMLVGQFAAWVQRRPRCADVSARAYLREQQRLRRLPVRVREALGL